VIAPLFASRARFGGHRTAVVDGDRRCTYAELARRGSRLANGLAGLGCRPGERVAIIGPNSIETIEWFLACAAGGFVGVAVNSRLGTPALRDMFATIDARAVIVDGRNRELAEELRDGDALPRTAVGLGQDHGCRLDYEAVIGAARDRIDLPAQLLDAPLLLTATSGTTGRVKLTVHSHLGIYTGIQCTQASLRMTPESRTLTALPMFFATATGGYWVGLVTGGEVHLLPAFDPERFVEEIGRSAITHSVVGPSPLYQVMDADLDLSPLRSMDFLGAGGAPFDPARFRELRDALGGVVGKLYSMSEITFSTVLRPEDVTPGGGCDDRVLSVGRPQPGADVRVLDDDGDDVDADGATVGEVVFSAPGIATQYWGDPDESALTFVDGTVRSGDLATIDPDGFLRIVDRRKDIIVSGGINVAPLAVESAIATHPAVQAVAVIGVPHPTWGESVHAVVVRRPGATLSADAVIAHAAASLGSVQKPQSVEFVDALPVNVTGKVLRRVLRDQRRAADGASP
jgi:acyl-CoA synthetase (AMP-forming)/AMP-acid ligase II